MRPTSVIAIVGFVLLGLLAVALAVMQMPARLRVAVGPEEFDHARLMAAFARKLNADRAPVRLTLIRKPDFAAQAAAVDSGEPARHAPRVEELLVATGLAVED